MIRITEKPIQWVLDHFTKVNGGNKKVKCNGNEYWVKQNSHRYILFKEKGLTCVTCGKTANKCYLEYTPGVEITSPHFNFYYVEKGCRDLLFTKDHIIPKALKGKDRQDNYQVMCQKCNCIKGDQLQ